MRRTEWLQEARKMRFEEAYKGCKSGRLMQAEAALLLGVRDRTFRRLWASMTKVGWLR
jgi:hypothetical protein